RVLQHGDVRQMALVLLNKGDVPAGFDVGDMLQPGEWVSALDGSRVRVAPDGRLATTVPAHGVQVFVLDGVAATEPALVAALDAAAAVARPRDNASAAP